MILSHLASFFLVLLQNHNIVGFSLLSKNENIIFAFKSQYNGIMERFGNIIKERRKELSITQRELAALAGIGINTLTKIERGEANPSLKIVLRVLDTLGLEMNIKIKSMNL